MSGGQITGFLNNLYDRPRSALKLLNVRPEAYPTQLVQTGDGSVVIQKDQSEGCLESQFHTTFNPQGAVAGTFNGGTIEFRINPSQLSYVNEVVLALTLKEQGGANPATPCAAYQMIQRVDVKANSGAPIHSMYGDMLLAENIFRTSEQSTALNSVNNLNATYAGTTAIAAGASQTYYIPFSNIFFARLEMFMPAVKGDILISVIFRPTSQTIEAGTGVLDVSAAQLIIRSTDISQNEYNSKMAEYRSRPHVFRFIETVYQPIPSQTITAGSANNIATMAQVNGLAAWFFAFLRAAPTNGTALRTVASNISSYQLNNQNGLPCTGGPLPFTYMNRNMAAEYFDSNFLQNIPLMYYVFTKNPKEVYETNKCCGFQVMSGQEALQYGVNASFSTGSYNLDAYWGLYCSITLLPDGTIVKATS